VTKNAGGVDKRTFAVVVVAIALLGVVGPLVASGGVGLDDGFYRVGVDEESPYYGVVEDDDTFTVHAPDREALEDESIELLITPDGIEHTQSAKGLAAREELASSVQTYNNRQLSQEANQTAAFPVSVILDYRQQSGLSDSLPTGEPDDSNDGDSGDDGESDGDGDGDGDSDGDDETPGGSDGGGDGLGGIGSVLSDDGVSGSPSDINPPFPFQSLVLAFVFVIPLNFLIQAYGSTILSERINRRGELLLVSPVSRLDIIGGKTLPYFTGAMLVESIIAVGLLYVSQGQIGGLVSILAMMPLVLLFLGATFLGAMFARSFKELTFVTVTITVGLTSYAFVPAIFTDVNAIALISPLTLVVRNLQGESIAIGEFIFSTTPPMLSALVFFGLGSGLYREEDMFDQRSITGKVLDSLAGPISRPWHVGLVTAVLIPFVFVVQLLAIALLFALGQIGIGILLVVVAITEEIAKSLHIYAAYEHNRFERSVKSALLLGLASGVGFFVAEKLALIAQLVGLQDLPIGEAGLQGGVPVGGPLILIFLLAPLVLHIVTAAISAVGASRNKRAYVLAIGVAMIVHFIYNYAVVVMALE